MESPGTELVRARGHAWSVLARIRHGDCEAVRLRGAGPDNAGVVRTLLTPFDRLAPITRPARWRRVLPRRWLHVLRRAALKTHPFGGLRAADESRIRLLPYQLEPALAVLRGATRVLIADDVGLGKTIQAGLILREMSARVDALRAIVVAPAALREQWCDELRERFDLAPAIADASWLVSTMRELPADVNPWSPPGVYLASYDFVKRPEVLRPLEEVTWDVAVFDEAHAAAPATERLAAAEAIAARARRVVLLTATPHSGDQAQFDALCRIGHAGEPLQVFQRSRVDAGSAVPRRSLLLTVKPCAAERRMHRLLERYAARIQGEAGAVDSRALLAAIVLRKRALSSAASLHASAARRQELLAGAEPESQFQLALPLGDEDPLQDAVTDAALAAPGLRDASREQRMLDAIVRAARLAAARETKTAFLLRLLRRVREPAIVFTEYRDTLFRLARALEADGLRVQTLHGGMTPEARSEVQRAFNAGGGLLLATDAASEGLNLHHRCRLVIHYELPWSPVRLQQRTGRVDRIGQAARVHEILLVAGDTAERLVLAPLARRVVAACAMSAGASRLFSALTESRVAAAVLKGEAAALAADPPVPQPERGDRLDLHREAVKEVARLLDHRAWRAVSAAGANGHVTDTYRPVATLKRIRFATFHSITVLVVGVTLRDRDGQMVHAELVPAAIDTGQSDESVLECVERAVRNRLETAASEHRIASAALRRREEAIAAAVPHAARQLVQAGLFDRRAIRAADARGRAASALLEDSVDRIEALRNGEPLVPSFAPIARLVLRQRRR